MVPIYIYRKPADSEIGYNYDQFKSDFLSICEQHHQTNRALAFAFILYGLQNPAFVKVLRDRDYLNALDQLSANYLSIYYIDTSQPGGKKVSRRLQDLRERAEGVVKKHVASDAPESFPVLLFFQVDHKKVIDAIYVKLSEQDVQSCYLELKSYISSAVEALKLIQNQNETSRAKIFDKIRRNVRSTHRWVMFKRFFSKAMPIMEFLSLFKP